MIKQVLYFGNQAELHVRNSQLCIYTGEHKDDPITRPLEDIGIVIIDNPRIMLTTSVMTGLMESGAALLVCGPNHMPTGLMLNLEGHCEQSERFRTHLSATLPMRKQLWQQTVKRKILNQAAVAKMMKGAEVGNMIAWAKSVKSGDTDNREGLAAGYYWRVLFEDMPGVTRDRGGAEPNSLLNYGYAIVRATVARALVASGMHPSIGIYHRNKYNAYCLADDVMEPYRPYVDLTVLEICNEIADATLENREVKRRLLSITTREVEIEGMRRPLMTGVSDTASSLMKCFAGKSSIIRYPTIAIPDEKENKEKAS